MSKCKDCHKAANKENRRKNIEYYLAYDKQRANDEHRVRARREYAQTERGKEKLLASRRAWQQRNPERRAAHIAVGNAVRDGRLVKPTKCEDCGMETRLQGHHDDYSKPLSVTWLCVECHSRRHLC